MDKLEMFGKVLTDLEDMVNDIFLKYQQENDIKTGDLDPWMYNELCDMEHDLADVIAKCLVYQYENK